MNIKPTRDLYYLIAIALLIAFSAQMYYSHAYLPMQIDARVYYNHDVAANKQIIQTVREAHQYVYFAIYTFTRDDIADALVAAKERGLEVKGLTDKKQVAEIGAQKNIVKKLNAAGIPVATQDHSAIMHVKTVVTDNGYVSGSYNWTAAATDSNDEVIEVGHDEAIRKQYERVLRELFARYGPSS